MEKKSLLGFIKVYKLVCKDRKTMEELYTDVAVSDRFGKKAMGYGALYLVSSFPVIIGISVVGRFASLDLEVGKWLRKHAPQIKPIVVMNKSESVGESLAEVASEALALGFGEPTAISAET